MPGGSYDTDKIRGYAALTETHAAQLQDAIDTLRSGADELAAAWTDPSGNSFHEALNQWEATVRASQQALAELAQRAKGAADGYDAIPNN